MRRPSTRDEQLAWHRATLAGERPPRIEDVPECGWYKRRYVKGGPFVPVLIYLEQEVDPETGELVDDETFRANCNGEAVDPAKVWNYCKPISEEEYEALVALHERDAMMAATHAPVDLARSPARPTRS